MHTINDELLEFTEKTESQYLLTKDHWREQVKEYFSGDPATYGDPLPWSKTHGLVRLRPGELSLWAGVNGHYKSYLTGQIALWLQRHTRVLVASLEMPPEITIARMVRQAAGCDDVTSEFTDRFLNYKTDNLWMYDQQDTVPPDRILNMTHLAAHKYGIKHIFIDSLVKCGISPDDYNKQKEFVDKLCWVAKSNKIHIHLVHHVRKGESESHPPDKWDVKGAGELTDLAHNVFIPHRNLLKEKQKLNGEEVDDTKPDFRVRVAKQRNGGWEEVINLWTHAKSMQFLPRPSTSPMIYDI